MKKLQLRSLSDNGPPKTNEEQFKNLIKLNKMKTSKLLFFALLLYAGAVNAQIDKKNWMVGGSGNFSSNRSNYTFEGNEIIDKRTVVNLAPNIGYFVIDKLAVGTYIKFGFDDFGGLNSTSFGFGPFARYYFLENERLVNFFGQINFGYNEGKSNNGGEYHINDYGLRAGTVIFFNSSVGLEIALEYNSSKNNSVIKNNSFQVGLGFQIHLKK